MSTIPFAPPRIDERIIEEVVDTLRSGWITTGPKTKLLERHLSQYNGNPNTLCLNSATAGLEIMLRWFGVKEGDEVILPAYTYSATANVVMHCGATPILVDTRADDFNIDVAQVRKAITPRTKVIMPVDFGGFPCDYDALNSLVKEPAVMALFKGNTDIQQKLGRIMVLSDAAHSLGAWYKGKHTGILADATVFSFHAVKNLTTAEGGAVALNLPAPFDNQAIYQQLCISTLHGQSKDALAKMQKGNWKYDIVEAGYKCNMTDISAAMGLVELDRYDSDTLAKRKSIVDRYRSAFSEKPWAQLPPIENTDATSSFHLFALRIKDIDEETRDSILQVIFHEDVSVNVHFIPIPLLSFYAKLGYKMNDYPVAYDNFSREISLPVFYDLTPEWVERVISVVTRAVERALDARA